MELARRKVLLHRRHLVVTFSTWLVMWSMMTSCLQRNQKLEQNLQRRCQFNVPKKPMCQWCDDFKSSFFVWGGEGSSTTTTTRTWLHCTALLARPKKTYDLKVTSQLSQVYAAVATSSAEHTWSSLSVSLVNTLLQPSHVTWRDSENTKLTRKFISRNQNQWNLYLCDVALWRFDREACVCVFHGFQGGIFSCSPSSSGGMVSNFFRVGSWSPRSGSCSPNQVGGGVAQSVSLHCFLLDMFDRFLHFRWGIFLRLGLGQLTTPVFHQRPCFSSRANGTKQENEWVSSLF